MAQRNCCVERILLKWGKGLCLRDADCDLLKCWWWWWWCCFLLYHMISYDMIWYVIMLTYTFYSHKYYYHQIQQLHVDVYTIYKIIYIIYIYIYFCIWYMLMFRTICETNWRYCDGNENHSNVGGVVADDQRRILQQDYSCMDCLICVFLIFDIACPTLC